MGKYPCGICKKEVKDNQGQGSLQCCVCERWIHKACGIPDHVYKLADEMFKLEGYHIWACDGCGIGLKKIQMQMSKHNREIEKLKSDFEQITQRQDSADERMDKADTKNNKLEERVVSLETAAPANAEENVYQEMRERKNKESNVIIHGIAESKSKRPSDRKSDDIEEVKSIMTVIDINLNDEEDIKFSVRLGEPNNDVTRPLLVGFRENRHRNRVLKNAWKLKDSDYSDISIAPDLTQKQRRDEKRLTEERNEKNDNRSDEEAKNFEWKLVGLLGERILVKGKPTVKRPAQNNRKQTTRPRVDSQRKKRDARSSEDEEEASNSRPPKKRQS